MEPVCQSCSHEASDHKDLAGECGIRRCECRAFNGGEVAKPEQIDLRDEASQKDFDEQVIGKTLSELRGAMANLKVNYQIAKAGISQVGNKKGHPNQIAADIIECRKAIDLLVALGRDLDNGPVPEPKAGATIETPELVVVGDPHGDGGN